MENTKKTNLEIAMVEKNISKLQLSELTGLSIDVINSYLYRRRDINKASVLNVRKLAKALDKTIEEITEFE